MNIARQHLPSLEEDMQKTKVAFLKKFFYITKKEKNWL